MHFIGSIYAPWTPWESYYQMAYAALRSSNLPKTGFTVQALLLFAIAQNHCDRRPESHEMLALSIFYGLDLQMNTKEFASLHGEGNPVLQESWRRTYYFLELTDQHFSVLINNPQFRMMNVPNYVDLPCDDLYYDSGVSLGSLNCISEISNLHLPSKSRRPLLCRNMKQESLMK
jgi:hypothetical protein